MGDSDVNKVPTVAKILGAVDIVVICTATFFIATMSTRLDVLAEDAAKMEDSKIPEQLVEMKNEQKHIKEDVAEVKDTLKDVVRTLSRIESKVSDD